MLAPDQGREMLAVQSLEAGFGPPFTLHPPGADRLGEAFEAERTVVSELEQAADEPARRLADYHLARRRERLHRSARLGVSPTTVCS